MFSIRFKTFLVAQNPDSQKDKNEGAVLGETTGAPSELTTPESSSGAESSATTPSEGSQSTTGLPETSGTLKLICKQQIFNIFSVTGKQLK